jgi:hypothetical protein
MTTMTREKVKVRIGTGRELVDSARKALAQSKAKGGKRAVKVLENAHSDVFALEDLAKNAQAIGFQTYLVERTCRQLCKALCDNFDAARAELPKAHPAQAFLKKATAAVHDLCYITEHFSHDSGTDAVTLAAAGRAMLGFVRDAGRWMERAELAIEGGGFFSGWLDFSNVEGLEGYKPESGE